MKSLIMSAAIAAGVVMCPGIGMETADAQNRNRSDRIEVRNTNARTYHYRGGRRDRWDRWDRRGRRDRWDRGDWRRWQRRHNRYHYRNGYGYGYGGYGYYNSPWGEGFYTPGFGVYWR